MTAAPIASLTDEQLVARFRAGEDRAFEEIHQRHHAALLSFAGRMLRASGHDPQDIVQDAFIRAYRSLRSTARPMAVRAWLFMIVRNRALDELRGARRGHEFGDDSSALAAIDGCDPAQRAAQRDELRQVVAEIARLPPRQRMALVLREFDGRSVAETARALNTTVPGTKSLMVRARSNLGAALRAA